jgi:hypothetical protein
MMNLFDRSISIMVCYAIGLHLSWAVILLIDSSATNATAVHALYRYLHSVPLLSLMLFAAAGLAMKGLCTRVPWIVLLLLPQQILLLMSAAGAVEAIWISQFADGVIRPRAFLAADQIYSILAAIGHTVAIIAHARRLVR